MYLTEYADILIAAPNICTATGVVRRIIGAGLVTRVVCANIAENSLNNALEGEEIRAIAVGAECEVLRFDSQTVLTAETVGSAYLVKLYRLVAEVKVAGEYLQH